MKKYVKIITIMVMTTVAMPLVAQNSNPIQPDKERALRSCRQGGHQGG